jgi:surface protein
MFYDCEIFNSNINNWNVSKVDDMSAMFSNCYNFNQPLSNWDTSSAINMSFMFSECYSFNQYIGNWNTINVNFVNYMFSLAFSFNNGQDTTVNIPNVNVSEATFNHLTKTLTCPGATFSTTLSVNDSLIVQTTTGQIVISRIEEIKSDDTLVFYTTRTTPFSSPINIIKKQISGTASLNWDTSKVTQMVQMFYGCYFFNQPLNNFNTSLVSNMLSMFGFCYSFNQPLNAWNVEKVVTMNNMFQSAVSFNNQSISSWNPIAPTITMQSMFLGASINAFGSENKQDTSNYDNLLQIWSGKSIRNGLTFNAGLSKYSSTGQPFRTTLTSAPKSWFITDGGLQT